MLTCSTSSVSAAVSQIRANASSSPQSSCHTRRASDTRAWLCRRAQARRSRCVLACTSGDIGSPCIPACAGIAPVAAVVYPCPEPCKPRSGSVTTVTIDTNFGDRRRARRAQPRGAPAPHAKPDTMTSTAELSSPASAGSGLTRGVTDRDYTLEHKYSRTEGRIYLSGVQALVRLPLMQRLRDQAAGLNTGGFISGYRGSPLGGFDLELWRAKQYLADANVKFQPGLNEDLGATMVWGTQQTNLFPGAKVDGVYAMWYGKGPGVDRS